LFFGRRCRSFYQKLGFQLHERCYQLAGGTVAFDFIQMVTSKLGLPNLIQMRKLSTYRDSLVTFLWVFLLKRLISSRKIIDAKAEKMLTDRLSWFEEIKFFLSILVMQ